MVSGRLGQYLSKHPGEDKEKTGHFLGNHSVLDILRMEGYEIVHLPSDHQEQVTESERDRDLPAAGSVAEPSDTSTVTPTSWSTSLEEEMKDPEDVPGLEEEELPHMLLPDNLNQLEEFGRHKRPHKAQRSHGRPRLFSDLWVRMGESTPPPNMRITSGYITVDTPLTHQEHHRQLEIHSIERHNSPFPTLHSLCSAHLAKTSLTLSCILVWFLSHMLLTS